jgi:hypothetical protein
MSIKFDIETLKSVKKIEITAVGIRHADRVAPLFPQKLALTSPTSGGRSVGIVRSRTQATELVIETLKYPELSVFYGHVPHVAYLVLNKFPEKFYEKFTKPD